MTSYKPTIPACQQGIRFLMKVRKDPLGYFTKLMIETGASTWIKLDGIPVLVLNDATGIQHVFQGNAANYTKSPFIRTLTPLLGEGIFLSEGNKWRKQRQDAAPAFANGHFEDISQQVVDAVESMFVRWDEYAASGIPVDITVEFMALTFDVLLRAMFHEPHEQIALQMQTILGTILREAEGRIWSPLNLPQKAVYLLPKYRKALKFLDSLVDELITARRNNLAYPGDLLSRLIKGCDGSFAELRILRDQMLSFLVAGHETTAHSLTWAIYELARHPLARDMLDNEVRDILDGENPDFETAKQLTYSRQVMDEALRLYPPVWTMSRQAIAEDKIPLDDGSTATIPKGACVMLCDYTVHRRPEYWTDPEAFLPERFSKDNSTGRHPFSWFPFGGGPRLCLGFKFAQIEAVIAMAMISQRYALDLVPGQTIKPKPIITLRPDKPMYFKIRKRKQATFYQKKNVNALFEVPSMACPHLLRTQSLNNQH